MSGERKQALKLVGGRGERQAQVLVAPVPSPAEAGAVRAWGSGKDLGLEPDGSRLESTVLPNQLQELELIISAL